MKLGKEISLALLLAAAPTALAATKDQELPDKEMLRMMEFLKEMEMIKQMDILRDLHQVDGVGDQVKTSANQRPAPAQKKGIVR